MDTEFCAFLDKKNPDATITFTPLGVAKNTISKPTLSGWKNLTTDIVIDKKFTKGLDGLDGYSHIIVVYWMGQEDECHLRHHPQGNKNVPFVGIFACRCPQRPNRIAISTVQLVSRSGNVLMVKGLDILDATPVLDIKPYTPVYDKVALAKVPAWVDKLVF